MPDTTVVLPTISRVDVVAQVPLLDRIDRKYLLDGEMVDRLCADLAPLLRVVEHDGRQTFGYHTTYFDTADFALYRRAATGRRVRHKVRLRHYLDSGDLVFEVKTKARRGRTNKHRLDVDTADFTDEVRDAIRSITPWPEQVDALVASLVTEFERRTLVDTSTSSRLTIDTNVRCSTPDGRAVSTERWIVETKSPSRASEVDRWLWRNGQRPSKISKYSTSIAMLHPELPGNRWHRTIARHFEP